MRATATQHAMSTKRFAGNELSDEQFACWARLIYQRTGIEMKPTRRGFLASKLRIRMRELGVDSFNEYYRRISQPVQGEPEWALLVDRLTVHETRFFRHPESFELVKSYTSAWLDAYGDEQKALRLWSVGCASGEETYSLAMLVDSLFSEKKARAYYALTGSDISVRSLNEATQGIYPQERLQAVSTALKNKYTRYHDDDYGDRQFSDELRKRICFTRVGMEDIDAFPGAQWDIIFCQNVLIYFEQAKRNGIVHSLASKLRPGGLLILGVGEIFGSAPETTERLNDRATLAFRKLTD